MDGWQGAGAPPRLGRGSVSGADHNPSSGTARGLGQSLAPTIEELASATLEAPLQDPGNLGTLDGSTALRQLLLLAGVRQRRREEPVLATAGPAQALGGSTASEGGAFGSGYLGTPTPGLFRQPADCQLPCARADASTQPAHNLGNDRTANVRTASAPQALQDLAHGHVPGVQSAGVGTLHHGLNDGSLPWGLNDGVPGRTRGPTYVSSAVLERHGAGDALAFPSLPPGLSALEFEPEADLRPELLTPEAMALLGLFESQQETPLAARATGVEMGQRATHALVADPSRSEQCQHVGVGVGRASPLPTTEPGFQDPLGAPHPVGVSRASGVPDPSGASLSRLALQILLQASAGPLAPSDLQLLARLLPTSQSLSAQESPWDQARRFLGTERSLSSPGLPLAHARGLFGFPDGPINTTASETSKGEEKHKGVRQRPW